MTEQLTLRLQEHDVRLFNKAAETIAGKDGAPFVGRTTIVRRALTAFLDQHEAAAAVAEHG